MRGEAIRLRQCSKYENRTPCVRMVRRSRLLEVMNLLGLVLRNLSRNRRRTLLTVLSIAVSVFMFGALMSLPTLVDEILKDRANSVRIITYAKTGLSYPLPAAYAAKIAQVPHVEAVTGESVFPGTYRDPKDFVPAAAMDPTQLEALFPDWNIKPAEAAELQRTRSGALVGAQLMKLYHWRVGDNLILHGVAYPIDLQLKIVGTIGGSVPPSAVVIRQDFLDEALGRFKNLLARHPRVHCSPLLAAKQMPHAPCGPDCLVLDLAAAWHQEPSNGAHERGG